MSIEQQPNAVTRPLKASVATVRFESRKTAGTGIAVCGRIMTPARSEPVVMSDAQRLQRIAEILCKAILLDKACQALQPACMTTAPLPVLAAHVPPIVAQLRDERILSYLELVGEASPAKIRRMLGFSRSGAYRALRRLTVAGRIVASGQTRLLAYRLNSGEPSVGKIGLN